MRIDAAQIGPHQHLGLSSSILWWQARLFRYFLGEILQQSPSYADFVLCNVKIPGALFRFAHMQQRQRIGAVAVEEIYLGRRVFTHGFKGLKRL